MKTEYRVNKKKNRTVWSMRLPPALSEVTGTGIRCSSGRLSKRVILQQLGQTRKEKEDKISRRRSLTVIGL